MAKKGARAHYAEEHWSQAWRNEKKQSEMAALCTWIGTALGEWPQEAQIRRRAADRAAMREKKRARRMAARRVGGHRLDWTRDGWKCRYCGTTARAASGIDRVMNQPCSGHTAARIPRQASHGVASHVLWTAEADDAQRQVGADVTWCSICGAYSSTKIYKLRGECRGPADRAALTRLRALQGLRHPVLGYRLKKPHRMTDRFMDAMAERGGERRELYYAAMREDDAGTDGMGCNNPATRLEPDGHGAGSAGDARAEPSGHAAMPEDGNGENMGSDTDREEYTFGHGGELYEDVGEALTVQGRNRGHADPRLEPRHGAGSVGGERAEPSGHAAEPPAASGPGLDTEFYDDEDVFGHGGALDEDTDEVTRRVRRRTELDPAPWLEQMTHSSVEEGASVRSAHGTRPPAHGDNACIGYEDTWDVNACADEGRACGGMAQVAHGPVSGPRPLEEPSNRGAAIDSSSGSQRGAGACDNDTRGAECREAEPRKRPLAEEAGRALDLGAAAAARSEAAAKRINALRDRVRAKERAAKSAAEGPAEEADDAKAHCAVRKSEQRRRGQERESEPRVEERHEEEYARVEGDDDRDHGDYGAHEDCARHGWQATAGDPGGERVEARGVGPYSGSAPPCRGAEGNTIVKKRVTGKRAPCDGQEGVGVGYARDAASDIGGAVEPITGVKRRRLRSKTKAATA